MALGVGVGVAETREWGLVRRTGLLGISYPWPSPSASLCLLFATVSSFVLSHAEMSASPCRSPAVMEPDIISPNTPCLLFHSFSHAFCYSNKNHPPISVPDSSRVHWIFVPREVWKAGVHYQELHIYGQKPFVLDFVLP